MGFVWVDGVGGVCVGGWGEWGLCGRVSYYKNLLYTEVVSVWFMV